MCCTLLWVMGVLVVLMVLGIVVLAYMMGKG